MPFCALDENKNRLNTFDNLQQIDELRKIKNVFWCPNCNDVMTFAHGNVVVPHFKHKILCKFASEPESKQHLTMKAHIKHLFPSAILENRIGERINDITIPEFKVAIEVQVSNISEDDILQRTLDYNKYGFSVLWIFGNRSDDELSKLRVHIKKQERVLKRLYHGRFWVFHNGSFKTITWCRDTKRCGYFVIQNDEIKDKTEIYDFDVDFMSEEKWQMWSDIKNNWHTPLSYNPNDRNACHKEATQYLQKNAIKLKLASFSRW